MTGDTNAPSTEKMPTCLPCALCGEKWSHAQKLEGLRSLAYIVGCSVCGIQSASTESFGHAIELWNAHQAKINLAFERALQHGARQVINRLNQMERDMKMFGRVLTSEQREELNALLRPLGAGI